MDNLDKIKYKHSIPGWYYKIDINTNQKTEFNKKNVGLYDEMIKWKELTGKDIELQFTEAELTKKEAKELVQALETQNKTLISLMTLAERHFASRRWVDDRPKWEAAHDKWAEQYEANVLTDIYEKPTFT